MGFALLALLLAVLFAGAFVSGVAGFALGIIVLAVWLHFLSPLECAFAIVAYGLVTQGYGAWKMRHAFHWRRVLPFVAGGIAGAPLGTLLLSYSDPAHVKLGVGLLVILYSLYGLAKPALRIANSNTAVDTGVGVVNGLTAGLIGLIGIVITIWCQLRGWPKDEQRAVFQPVMLAASVTSVVPLTIAGAATPGILRLVVLGLPVVFAGTWLGLRLYGKVNEAGFRRLVLVLLLASGVGLVAR